jgi:hypothetical protein
MNSLKSITSSRITCNFENEKHILQVNDQTLIELKKLSGSKSIFEMDDEKYVVRKDGFLNPVILIERYGTPLIVLKWIKERREAKIEFRENNSFLIMTVKENDHLFLFYNSGGAEILRFSPEHKIRIKTVLRLLECEVNETQFLMLFVISFMVSPTSLMYPKPLGRVSELLPGQQGANIRTGT